MAYIQGEGRNQGTLFPVALDDLVPVNHICRVIDAFVELLNMEKLGFERWQAAETGRPGYDPRTLLKLYLYGYLNQIRSSRRLEAECILNIRNPDLDPVLSADQEKGTSRLGCVGVASGATLILRCRSYNFQFFPQM